MKHTPGPWEMNDRGPGLEGPRFTVDAGGEPKTYWLVATVTRPDDARLIAAAPELLAALKEVRKVKGMTGDSEVDRLVHQSIAKAEGKDLLIDWEKK